MARADEVLGARAPGSASAWIVSARSAAEIPVVTPAARSTETVNAVPCTSWLLLTISGRSRASSRSPVSEVQITPDV
jgi:hypothetical protein